jgi:hypothetical protein
MMSLDTMRARPRNEPLSRSPRGFPTLLSSRNLWSAAALALAITAGCSTPPPAQITIKTQNGTGGSDSSGSGGGSTGGSDGSGGVPGEDLSPNGKAYYLSTVHPELYAGCATCHASGQNDAPVFLGEDGEASYKALIKYGGLVIAPDNSLLVLHGAHTGPAPSEALKTDMITWLTMEAQDRGLLPSGGVTTGGSTTTMTLKQALDEYSACMDMSDWKSNGLDKLYSTLTAQTGPCGGCHSSGDGGNWLSSNVQETFDMNKKFPYIKRQVTGTVDADGNFKDLIASKRFSLKGGEPCQPNTLCHPKFTLPASTAANIDKFVSTTLDKWRNKQCGP